MKGILQTVILAAVFSVSLVVPPNAFAHGGGGGGGGGGHGGGGHSSGGGYYSVYVGGGGAVGVPDSTTGNYSSFHKIALLSAIGTNFSLPSGFPKAVGPDITAWQVDALVGTTLRKYLQPNYTLVDMPFDKNALIAVHKQMFRERDTLDWLKTLPNPGVDAYMLVRPSDDALPGPASLGIEIEPGLQVFLFSNFEIDIIDAKTFAYVGKAFAHIQLQDGQPPAFAASPLTLGSVARVLVGGGDPGPSLDLVHRQLEDLLPHALVETVRSLRMGVALPPVGDHSISEPATAHLMRGIRTVAVASAIGDTFQLINPGNMFVKKTEAEMPFGENKIDEQAEAIARNVLMRHYVVKDAPIDRSLLAHMVVVPGTTIPAMAGVKPAPNIDAYVLIVKVKRPEGPYSGIGLQHITPLMNHVAAVYADYAVVVVDAHALKGVTGTTAGEGTTSPCAKPDTFPMAAPECSVDESLWPADGTKLTPDNETKASAEVMKLLSNGIPETLFRLGLDEAGPSAAPAVGGK